MASDWMAAVPPANQMPGFKISYLMSQIRVSEIHKYQNVTYNIKKNKNIERCTA